MRKSHMRFCYFFIEYKIGLKNIEKNFMDGFTGISKIIYDYYTRVMDINRYIFSFIFPIEIKNICNIILDRN